MDIKKRLSAKFSEGRRCFPSDAFLQMLPFRFYFVSYNKRRIHIDISNISIILLLKLNSCQQIANSKQSKKIKVNIHLTIPSFVTHHI